MPNLTPQEQQELQDFIRENFSQEDLENLAALGEFISRFDAQSLKEAMQRLAKALNSIDTNDFNEKLTDLLIKARAKKEVTTEKKPAVGPGRIKPQQFISPNTKASNSLFDSDNSKYYHGMRWLSVEGKKSKKDISVSLFVRYDRYDERINTSIQLFMPAENQMLTLFDRTVHDAIVAHILNGSNNITTNMIYQVISGNSEGLSSNNPVPKSLSKAISESIDRLFHSWVEIDAKEQAKAYGFDNGIYKGHLLTGSIVEASLKGNITTCAHIAEWPVLYRYANDCGQVIRYDVKALNVPTLENSVEGVVLKTYLLQQISIMSRNKEYSRTLCFDTLYDLLNVQGKSKGALRKKKMKIRDHVIKCLDYWTAEKLVEGFERYTLNSEGRAIVSVTLRVKLISKPTVR